MFLLSILFFKLFFHNPKFLMYNDLNFLRSRVSLQILQLFLSNKSLFSMSNFDYYPGEDIEFDSTSQDQASGSSDIPHEASTIRKLPGTQTSETTHPLFANNSSKNKGKGEISNNKIIMLIYMHFY